MRIQHNIMAMNAYRNLSNNNKALSGNLEKLSSGYRINRAGDDAAGLAISEKMRAQITGLDVAQDNAQSGINLVQTAEGALTEVHDMLNRMYELAEQSANGTYDDTDRAQLQKEVANLKTEINRIADSANFNGINLLDGNLRSEKLSVDDVLMNTVTTADGVNLGESVAGQGTKGTFVLDVKNLHGTGDTIVLDGMKSVASGGAALTTITLNYDKTATSSTQFSGGTVEEQAASIAQALSMNGEIAADFDVTVDGSKVVITAKHEGVGGASISSAKSNDKTIEFGAYTNSTAGATAAGGKGAFETLFTSSAGTTSGFNVQAGDIIELTFKGAGGETLTAKVEITEDMVKDRDQQKLTEAFVNKLKDTYFEENADTGVSESKIKVSDLFTVNANKDKADAAKVGSVYVESKVGTLDAPTMKIQRADGSTINGATFTLNGAGTAGTAGINVVAAAANNFTAGDVFKMNGVLSDGQEFSVELVAGKDFEIGAAYTDSLDNIIKQLTTEGKAKVTVGGREVDASKVFGGSNKTAKDNIEFALKNNGGKLEITNGKAGVEGTKGVAGKVNAVLVSAAPAAESELASEVAKAQAGASVTITLDDKITNQYGTAIKVGDTTYEIVQDARDVTSRNNAAVVISDLKNATAADVAKALADAIQKNDEDGQYKVELSGTSIKVTTNEVGSNVAAIDVGTPYGEEVTTATFKFDTNMVKEGSILDFNGKTYEFVKKGEKPTGNGNIAIEVEDFSKATAKSLGDAFAAVAQNGIVSVAEDGTMTLKSTENADGTISAPSVSFKEGLTLQIGDTSESYNQLTVSIDDCHTNSLGIENLDIGTQKGAAAALNTIKDAINYVSNVRGTLGATQNRLDHTINNLSVMEENIQDAEANIRDTDVAEEMMEYTKNNILIQSAQAMLAQANQVPQGVLQLLG